MHGIGQILGIFSISTLLLTTHLSANAQADDNDLVLARLGTISGQTVIGSNIYFRSLASELGVVLAPRLSEPADTLGFGGFHLSADVAYTAITDSAAYWQVLESSPNPGAASHGNGAMQTTGFFVKKGIWLPLPSFEIGLGVVHLGHSSIWAPQGYLKFALHEGYHDLPLPSLAVRASVSKMTGSEQLDLTVGSFDISVSKDFGIGGLFKASPYLGWNWLLIIPRSEVLDKTPHIDSNAPNNEADASMNFVFKDQDDIVRNRLFLGTKLKHYIFTLTLEASFAFQGKSVDDQKGTDTSCANLNSMTPSADCDAKDTAGAQSTYTASLGLDF